MEIAKTSGMDQNDGANAWLWVGLLIAFLLSAFGWGSCLRRICTTPLLRFHSITVVAGLAVLNVIGGWLNVLSLATSPFLVALLVIGLLFTSVHLFLKFQQS